MIVAGFGFRAAATAESLADAFQRSGGCADKAATAADKAASNAFKTFAQTADLSIHPIDAATLTRQEVLTQSNASSAARGTGSVAEAAALAAAGVGGRLLGPRVVSGDGMATCALAEGNGT
ncbi:MAG: cobalamin biosynthesis protein [Pseudomonadota bacterium]